MQSLKRLCTYVRTNDTSSSSKRSSQEKMKAMEERIAELEAALARATVSNTSNDSMQNGIISNLNNNSSTSLSQVPAQMNNTGTWDFISPTTQATTNLSTNDLVFNLMSDSSLQFPILQQLAQSQLSMLIIQSQNDLPFSAEIIDDMIEDFFLHCNCWPVNFLHPNWVRKNRHRISRPLLLIICAISSRNSKYLPLFTSMGRNPGEELYRCAKKSFDFTETTLENFMCLIFMSIYNVMVGRMNDFWICLNVGVGMIGILKLHVDPDELELISNSPISNIEKECRKRLWWLVRGLAMKSPDTMKMIEGRINVSRALPLSVYHAMSEDESDSSETPQGLVGLDMYDIEEFSHDLHAIAESIKDFLERVADEKRSVDLCFIEADVLMNRLRQWFFQCPDWFHSVLDSPNICKNTNRKPDEIPFIALHIHLMYYSLQLTLYRFLYSTFCILPPDLQIEQSRSQRAIALCWNSHTVIMTAYRSRSILMESSYTSYPYSLGPLLHSIIFTCTMSKFADTPELCITATRDFKFSRNLLLKFISDCSFNWRVVQALLEDVDRVYSLPAGIERVNDTLRLFTFSSKLYEKIFFKQEEDPSITGGINKSSAWSSNFIQQSRTGLNGTGINMSNGYQGQAAG
ncbi:hypothetical protein HK098_006744 [Nowakowskiella sp. JEL0407]|nr:hypothetical protein HK098_006744 [Nowakowskiella sp. JEL0407]